jgi:hypothetical protein
MLHWDLGGDFAACAGCVEWRGHLSPVRWQVQLIPLLVCALLSLVPFAHASAPDATWIAGSYDADDLDQVVDAATSLVAGKKAAALIRGLAIVVEAVRPAVPVDDAEVRPLERPTVLGRLVLSSSDTRSPPAA